MLSYLKEVAERRLRCEVESKSGIGNGTLLLVHCACASWNVEGHLPSFLMLTMFSNVTMTRVLVNCYIVLHGEECKNVCKEKTLYSQSEATINMTKSGPLCTCDWHRWLICFP